MPRRAGLDLRVLVGEAASLADERGLKCVTLANLAERINVRTPSLYNHITNVEQLQNQLTIFALQSLRDFIARATIGKNGVDGLLAIANAHRNFAKEHPGLYAATERTLPLDDVAVQQIAQEMIDIVRANLVPFTLSDDATVHAIRGFRSIVQGFVSLEAARSFGFPQDIDESFSFVIQSFIVGLENATRRRNR